MEVYLNDWQRKGNSGYVPPDVLLSTCCCVFLWGSLPFRDCTKETLSFVCLKYHATFDVCSVILSTVAKRVFLSFRSSVVAILTARFKTEKYCIFCVVIMYFFRVIPTALWCVCACACSQFPTYDLPAYDEPKLRPNCPQESFNSYCCKHVIKIAFRTTFQIVDAKY